MNYGNFVELFKSIKEKALYDKKRTARIILIVIILIVALALKINAMKNHERIKEENTKETENTLVVDISGAINNPGVYNVKENTRVYEVIEMAGGLKGEADADSINQAEFVKDGQKIIIPTLVVTDDENSFQSDNNGKININTANKDKLVELSGIGDAIAQRIIEYRKEKRFDTIDDIKNVKGIGDAIFEKISNQITV